jgi:hypothetical protein
MLAKNGIFVFYRFIYRLKTCKQVFNLWMSLSLWICLTCDSVKPVTLQNLWLCETCDSVKPVTLWNLWLCETCDSAKPVTLRNLWLCLTCNFDELFWCSMTTFNLWLYGTRDDTQPVTNCILWLISQIEKYDIQGGKFNGKFLFISSPISPFFPLFSPPRPTCDSRRTGSLMHLQLKSNVDRIKHV